MFLNLSLKVKYCEAIRFICAREKGRVLQPRELVEDRMGFINETVTLVLARKHPHELFYSCYTLDAYKETPICIPTEIMEEAVESFRQKIRGLMAL